MIFFFSFSGWKKGLTHAAVEHPDILDHDVFDEGHDAPVFSQGTEGLLS